MADKLSRAPLPVDVFGTEIPFTALEAQDGEQIQLTALRNATVHAKRLEMYERYTGLPIAHRLRVVYISEMEIREAMVAIQQQYAKLVQQLQSVIGGQSETINALVEAVALLEARVPRTEEAPAEEQLSLELSETRD